MTDCDYATFPVVHGVWIIHKNQRTGELLGPSIGFDYSDPTKAVYAFFEGKWRELTCEEVEEYKRGMIFGMH